MYVGFVPASGGAVELWLDPGEGRVLASLLADLVDFVEPDDTGQADPLAAMVGIDPDATTPDDPAALRLFPDAYVDDAEAAGEFRRFTERGLREVKRERALLAIGTLDRLDHGDWPPDESADSDSADADVDEADVDEADVDEADVDGEDDPVGDADGGRGRVPARAELTRDEALAWLGALNDLRLVLGMRLEITDDNQAELRDLPDGHPAAAAFALYDFLTYLQDTCVDAVARR